MLTNTEPASDCPLLRVEGHAIEFSRCVFERGLWPDSGMYSCNAMPGLVADNLVKYLYDGCSVCSEWGQGDGMVLLLSGCFSGLVGWL